MAANTSSTDKVFLDPVEELAQAAYERFSYDDASAKNWDEMVFDERYLWRQIVRAVIYTYENQK